ncbi:alpha-1A adrenergic receptor isoform X2 [Chiloscyllium punctatum]|uniref:alpha-1A adrenergic receptor isoform X2 n=1 Tax=Chiloscyllium punctatum TaxID=137246 RepID=UPI003B6330D9
MTWAEWANRSVDGNGSGAAGNRSGADGSASQRQAVALGVALGALIAFAIAGNILVILSVACNRHLQTVTNYFVVNLAVADLLLSATILPFSASLEVFGYWAFGRPFCDVWAAVDVLCCTASIMSLCTISIDRYIGVRYSLRYPAIMTERKALWILLLLWLSSLVISVGPLLGWKEPAPADDTVCSITEEPGYALFSSLFSFYLPLTVILAMYCRIYVVARRTTRSLEAGVKRERGGNRTELVLRIHCRSAAGSAEEAGSSLRTRGQALPPPPPLRSSLSMRLLKFSREKKAAKTVGIVVGVFVLCWLPFFTILPLDPSAIRFQLPGLTVPPPHMQEVHSPFAAERGFSSCGPLDSFVNHLAPVSSGSQPFHSWEQFLSICTILTPHSFEHLSILLPILPK